MTTGVEGATLLQPVGRRLEGKVALITGASSGIGAAAAYLFAREGATVVLAARREAALVETVTAITAAGGTALAIPTDVAHAAALQQLVERTVETYGRLDVAFNNAGIPGSHERLAEISEARYARVLSVNLTGIFLAMKYEIRAMLRSGGGAIVNTSSVGGLAGPPLLADYGASKHGIIGLTKAAAKEYGKDGIRVNAIAPGSTLTEMMAEWVATDPTVEARLNAATPLGRMARPSEVAEAALWLCSDAASYVTGVVLPVDGGLLA